MIRIKSYLMFFLTTVTIHLPWLWIKMTSVLIFASTSNTQKAIMSKLHIYSDRQLLCCTTRSTEEKAFLPSEQNCVHKKGLLAKLQPFFVWLYPLYFKSRSPKPNSSNFSSGQPKPCYMRCSQTQKKPTEYIEKYQSELHCYFFCTCNSLFFLTSTGNL